MTRTPPLLLLLASAGFMSLVSTRIADGMLPALAHAFGATTTEAAATISAYAVAYGVMQVVYGPLGDRFGKPRVIMLATAWSAASSVLAAAAPTLQALVIARAAMGAGAAAIVPLGIAWIGDTVPLGQRQHALARYSGVTVFGIMLGPLLGGLVAQALSWRVAFVLLAVLFAAMSVLLLARERRAAARDTPPAPPRRPVPYLRQVGALLGDGWARLVMTAACLEAAFGIGCLAFVPTVLHARFGLSLIEGGTIAALFGVGGFLFTRAAAPLLRRFDPTAFPGVTGATMATAFLLLALMPHWTWAVAGCLLAGFGFFMMHNTLQVQATQLSSGGMGLAVSLFTSCIFVGQSSGVALGALVIAHSAPAWIFSAAAAGSLLLGTCLMRALRARKAQS